MSGYVKGKYVYNTCSKCNSRIRVKSRRGNTCNSKLAQSKIAVCIVCDKDSHWLRIG